MIGYITYDYLYNPINHPKDVPAVHWMTANRSMDHRSIEKLAPMLFSLGVARKTKTKKGRCEFSG